MRGGLDGLIRPTTQEQDTPTGTPEKAKRVHCNFVMSGDLHKRMKANAANKGITLIEALESACTLYLEKEENN